MSAYQVLSVNFCDSRFRFRYLSLSIYKLVSKDYGKYKAVADRSHTNLRSAVAFSQELFRA